MRPLDVGAHSYDGNGSGRTTVWNILLIGIPKLPFGQSTTQKLRVEVIHLRHRPVVRSILHTSYNKQDRNVLAQALTEEGLWAVLR